MTTDARAVIARLKTGLYLNNEWIDADEGKTFPVENPATGEVLAHVADGSVADAERAIAAAGAAQAGWAKTSPRERSEILRRAYELIIERTDELAAIMTAEIGRAHV